jgi:hypothetical protein
MAGSQPASSPRGQGAARAAGDGGKPAGIVGRGPRYPLVVPDGRD